MKKKELLIEAQKTGNIVKVKYTIGSQPNKAREIIPLKIENNKVLAKCLNSNAEKSFIINKLVVLTDQQYNDHPKWDPNSGFLTDYEEYVLMKEKRNRFFRYFSIVFVILALLFIYLFIKSKS